MGCESKRSFDITVCHVHEYRLSHVVEVVPECDVIRIDALCQVVDTLSSEHPTIGTWHARRLFVVFNQTRNLTCDFIHFFETQFRIRYCDEFYSKPLTQFLRTDQ